jgi:transposase
MPRYHRLELTTEQRCELEDALDHHALAHMREKASVLLKIANGLTAAEAAKAIYGLKARDTDTIYSWLKRYEQGGLEALMVQPGRGRKPAFSPSRA